jgi:hypothetical protein
MDLRPTEGHAKPGHGELHSSIISNRSQVKTVTRILSIIPGASNASPRPFSAQFTAWGTRPEPQRSKSAEGLQPNISSRTPIVYIAKATCSSANRVHTGRYRSNRKKKKKSKNTSEFRYRVNRTIARTLNKTRPVDQSGGASMSCQAASPAKQTPPFDHKCAYHPAKPLWYRK